jgi:hypothetical protein
VAKGKTFPLPLGVPAENDQYKLVPHSVAQLIHLLVERKRSSPVPVLKQSSTDMPAPRSVPARNRPSKPSANGSILEALQGGKAAKKTPKAKLVKLPAFSGRPVVQKLPVQEGPREYSRFTGALSFSFDARKSHTTTNVMSA